MQNNYVPIYNSDESINTVRKFINTYRIDLSKKSNGKDYLFNLVDIIDANVVLLKQQLNLHKENKFWYESLSVATKKSVDDLQKCIEKVTTYRLQGIKNFNSFFSSSKNEFLNAYIFPPIELSINYTCLPDEIIETQGTQENKSMTNLNTFVDDLINTLTEIEFKFNDKVDFGVDRAIKRAQSYNVFVLSKTIANTPKFFNLTTFIENLRTESTQTGTKFSFNLPGITSIFEDDEWKIKNIVFDKDNNYASDNSIFDLQKRTDYNSVSSFRDLTLVTDATVAMKKLSVPNTNNPNKIVIKDSAKLKFQYKSNLFFSNILCQNDLILITDEEVISKQKLYIEKSDLKGVKFCLIGLIDNVIESTQSPSNINITVNGRDLMKLLIDDGTYFFPNSYNNEKESSIFFNQQDLVNEKSFLRIQPLGIISELLDVTLYKIPFLMNFLFSRLSNIQICDDDALSFVENKSGFYRVKKEIKRQNGKNIGVRTGVDFIENAGVWSMTKLYIQKEVRDRMITSDNLLNYQGSLLNYVNKICQSPFVEFFGDTYEDKFYFICRKPPYDYQSIIQSPTVIITADEVESDSLSFNNNEIYSYYNLKPIYGAYITKNNEMNVLSAIFLPEYAEIWGAKPMDITSNYIQTVDGKNRNLYLELLKDLKFIVETNAHLPFTRQGTITLKGRVNVKKGIYCHYKPTNEVFYINSVVQQQISGSKIDFITILTVSRGMIDTYIIDPLKTRGTNKFSYFNIVDFSENYEKSTGAIINTDSSVKVNKEVFNFFLRKKQFT